MTRFAEGHRIGALKYRVNTQNEIQMILSVLVDMLLVRMLNFSILRFT